MRPKDTIKRDINQVCRAAKEELRTAKTEGDFLAIANRFNYLFKRLHADSGDYKPSAGVKK